MAYENEIVQKLLNEFIHSAKIDYPNNIENINIKPINSEEFENTIYKYEYYSKRYLRYLDDKSGTIKSMAYLSPQIEDKFFSQLVKLDSRNVFHYTTYESLIKILESGRLRFTSLAGLNDKFELNYFDSKANKKIEDEYHYKRIEAFNNRYIISCSMLQDDLNQWRLYGDDGKGISIEFSINEGPSEGFYIGKVIYGPDLIMALNQFVEKLLVDANIAFVFNRFMIWKHFFFFFFWSYEKEARIIKWNNGFSDDKTEWAINKYGILAKYQFKPLEELPVSIKSITLGPKINEAKLNIAQIKQYLRETGKKKTFGDIRISHISCYR